VRPASALLFDLRRSHEYAAAGSPLSHFFNLQSDLAFTIDSLSEPFFSGKAGSALFKSLFAFSDWATSRAVFVATLPELDPDAKCPGAREETHFEAFLLTLWRMRWRENSQMLADVLGESRTAISRMTNMFITLLCRLGRSLVWIPDDEYLLGTVPAAARLCGMGDVDLYGDCTDSMTEAVRRYVCLARAAPAYPHPRTASRSVHAACARAPATSLPPHPRPRPRP
jgi:hypothetical protein